MNKIKTVIMWIVGIAIVIGGIKYLLIGYEYSDKYFEIFSVTNAVLCIMIIVNGIQFKFLTLSRNSSGKLDVNKFGLTFLICAVHNLFIVISTLGVTKDNVLVYGMHELSKSIGKIHILFFIIFSFISFVVLNKDANRK